MKNTGTNNIPQVSVIMPVYNAELYLSRALESILSQTLTDIEIIVIDDGSTDSSPDIIHRYLKTDSRIVYYKNKRNLQIAASLNKGLKLAKSEFVARMDADDVSHPKRLERQYRLLSRRKNVAIVGTDILIQNEKGEVISKREYPRKSSELKRLIFRYSPFAHPSVMYRKSIILSFGGYNIDMVPCEDIDLWFRVGQEYEFATVKDKLLTYTQLPSSNSNVKLRDLEKLGFRIKWNAYKEMGYAPTTYDVLYNLMQFTSMWGMPSSVRVNLYNALRSRGII